jgi:hypothetical protein
MCIHAKLLNSRAAGRCAAGLSEWQYYTSTAILHIFNHVGDPLAPASRVLILCYAFLTLLLMNMYTASSASNINALTLKAPVHSFGELQGKRVLTWDKYVDGLKQDHNITATGHRW